MNKFAILAIAGSLAVSGTAFAENTQSVHEATEAVAVPVQVNAGMMLYSANGQRVAAVNRVLADGSPQVILNGRLVTVPAASLSTVDGKVTTSLTKSEIGRAK